MSFPNLANKWSRNGGKRRAKDDPIPEGLPYGDGGGGDDTISSSDYARKCRELMKLYKDLLSLGAKTIFDLPRIVVIGGQSSGKSSLVEAVSGINVPRDSGTCTRCPMVCTMSSDTDTWSCHIEITYEFDKLGRSLAQPRTEAFSIPIEDKDAVELWIRRAQAAVLSPHRLPSDFIAMSADALKQNARTDEANMLKFSRNIVNVNVRDPHATDLSFVDLPGLIQNADQKLIDEVRTLVESYVLGRNTLIVVAMPMTDDIEMIQALVIASTADPAKERTIGVLTKVDLLTEGSIGGKEKWRAVLEGREHTTTHGYYCVRLPDDSERLRKIKHAEAHANAIRFFETSPPWSTMTDRGRFGIPNFVENISALLVDLIERNLPELMKVVEEELLRCDVELAKLPPLPNVDSFTEVILRVNAFCKEVSDSINGVSNDKRFVHSNKSRYRTFKHDILMTTPDFRPYESRTNEHNYENSLVTTLTEPRWLCDIRKVIKLTIGWELPGEIPFEAIKLLIMQYTNLWVTPSKQCFEDSYHNLKSYVAELIGRHFGQFKYLEQYVSMQVSEQLNTCYFDAMRILGKALSIEDSPVFTQNTNSFFAEKEKWLKKYMAARKPVIESETETGTRYHNYLSRSSTTAIIMVPSIPPSVPTPPRVPTPPLHTFPLPSVSHLDMSPKTWSLDEELRVIATVQGYFQVAHQRIMDHVPLTIEHELHQTFAVRISSSLLSTIFKESAAGAINVEDLLKEDPALEKRRHDLQERRARLLQIKERLDHFGSADRVVEGGPIV